LTEWLLNLSHRRWQWLYKKIYPWFEHVTKPKLIVFAHSPEKLYRALEYIRRNETSRNLVIVYCLEKNEQKSTSQKLKQFIEYLKVFKEAEVFPLFNIEFLVEEQQSFGPEVIRQYASRFRLSLNNVFVGSIHEFHRFSFEEMGGVRIIQ
jgi:hypothetical protein